jgi:hypothetical protein
VHEKRLFLCGKNFRSEKTKNLTGLGHSGEFGRDSADVDPDGPI